MKRIFNFILLFSLALVVKPAQCQQEIAKDTVQKKTIIVDFPHEDSIQLDSSYVMISGKLIDSVNKKGRLI